jgi:hypothetical protein
MIIDILVSHSSVAAGYGGCMKQTPSTASTPWGPASIVEELTVPQRAGTKRFASIVQLLEAKSGERLIRFAYSTGGAARRGPVTFRAQDLEKLREALGEHPGLGAALGL